MSKSQQPQPIKTMTPKDKLEAILHKNIVAYGGGDKLFFSIDETVAAILALIEASNSSSYKKGYDGKKE